MSVGHRPHTHTPNSPHTSMLGTGVSKCPWFICNLKPSFSWREEIIVYKRISQFIVHNSLEIICNPQVDFFSLFYKRIGFKDLELIYSRTLEMHQQQIYKRSSFYVGWVRDTMLVYEFSLPSLSSVLAQKVRR